MHGLQVTLLQSGGFSWKELLLGHEEWQFLIETVLRTVIMFLILLTALRILGKRGVKQLSLFELVVIIGLGSAAGDPMFYKDVGILPAFVVFTLVVSLYSFVMYLVGKSKKFERLVEGSPVCLVEEGCFAIQNFEKETLAQDEFYAELRLKGVSHLGQIEKAIIETNGGISIYYYADADVKWGLPILPGVHERHVQQIMERGIYACTFCGYASQLAPAAVHVCPQCNKKKWVSAVNHPRIV